MMIGGALIERAGLIASIGAALLALSSCQSEETDDQANAELRSDTLASVLADADHLSSASAAFGETGLAPAFDSVASYTVFAPNDAAFEAFGEIEGELQGDEERAVMAAILRDHIVPGYLTTQDIGNAIGAQREGSVEIQTMGDEVLTFSREGGAISVSNTAGESALLLDGELQASNGVVIPVDGVLHDLQPAS